jgi:hypothetical protein
MEHEVVIHGAPKHYKRTHAIYVIGDVAFVANPNSRSCWWKTHVSVAIGACPTCKVPVGQICKPSFGFSQGRTHETRRRLARGRDPIAMKVLIQKEPPR